MKSRSIGAFRLKTAVTGLTASLFFSCGVPQEPTSNLDIVGGEKVGLSDPVTRSTVALVNARGSSFCTGSLIAKRWVLTAAHCIVNYDKSDPLVISFGPEAKRGSFQRSNLRVAKTFKAHPNYDPSAMPSSVRSRAPADIGIIELRQDAPRGFNSTNILSSWRWLRKGEPLVLAGFGRQSSTSFKSGELHKVTTKVLTVDSKKKEIIYGRTPGKSACNGDSGGPAFVKRSGKLVLVGVTSRGPRNCNTTGIYTDARKYRSWIAAEMRSRS